LNPATQGEKSFEEYKMKIDKSRPSQQVAKREQTPIFYNKNDAQQYSDPKSTSLSSKILTASQ
jgi:hypothetical protein